MGIPLLLLEANLVKRQGTPRILDAKPGRCDIFRGRWTRHNGATYYTNSSCTAITDQLNCFKFGRPDFDFLNWRWIPYGCDLPKIDAQAFLEFVRGKSMAFVGDSIGRNQMHSLQCILAEVDKPEDVSDKEKPDPSFPRWHFPRYNFTVAAFFTPFLVKATTDDAVLSGASTVNLYLDEPDPKWASQIGSFDVVVIAAAHWLFSNKLIFHSNGRILGCSSKTCNHPNVTPLVRSHGMQKVFRTTFQTLLRNRNYRGVTFLRTFSPQHFENGGWDSGGTCARTRPIAAGEALLKAHEEELYLAQTREFREAERAASKTGLKFRLLDTTEMMLLRPDGHPNVYNRYSQGKWNKTDCVHWCLPGPIDTWNEMLHHLLVEAEGKGSV
ncbi:hypothetical protein MLD38_034708 [Melastoma candidum]|uniref:Uncharacterized protein n=1 Tax=Melastoma candidum TaxID=119954 RepID=A0ACB9MDA1_9MYRT|nr:hypothetical protein MLD38_034708 [Melastoma candidum]